MKKFSLVMAAVWCMFLITNVCFAQEAVLSEDFTVSANVPTATGILPVATRILYVEDGDDEWLDDEVGTSLGFGELTLNTFEDAVTGAVNNIFLPDNYYAIDVGVNGVYPNNGQITVAYTDVLNPNATLLTRDGLRSHGTATFKKVEITGTNPDGSPIETETTLGAGKYLLGSLPPGVTFTSLRGGWLRLYVGLVTLDPDADIPDPTGSQAFTPADMGGDYQGYITLTFSPL